MKSKFNKNKIGIFIILLLSLFLTSCEYDNYAVFDVGGKLILEQGGSQTNQVMFGTDDVFVRLNAQDSTPFAVYRKIYVDGHPTESTVANGYADMTATYTLLYNKIPQVSSVVGYLDVSNLDIGEHTIGIAGYKYDETNNEWIIDDYSFYYAQLTITPECEGNETTCDGSNILVCSEGQFITQQTCPGICSESQCVACIENDVRCNGNNVQICQNGVYITQQTCPVMCQNNVCVECTENELQCNGNNLEICTGGQFTLQQTCTNGCENNTCIGEPPEDPWVPQGCMPQIGSMVNNYNIRYNSDYRNAFEDVFNRGFVAGIPKFWFLLPDNPPNNENRPPLTEADFNLDNMDGVISFFSSRGYNYDLYHNIIVHEDEELPNWYKNLPTDDDRRAALETHVRTVSSHFEGQVPIINVVNHPYKKPSNSIVSEYGYMRTGWSREETFINVFQWAHEENPGALLIMNEGGDNWGEGGVATNPTKTQEYVNNIMNLRNQGVPIEGIGIMGHYGYITGKLPSDDTLRQVFSILQSTGLPIYITEFDISYDWAYPTINPTNEFEGYSNYWDYQAYAMRHLIEIADEYENIKGIYLWGILDNPSSWRTGTGIYYNDYSPKPAHAEIQELVQISQQHSCSLT